MLERYYRELLNFLAHRLRDRDAAADLAQESFVRVYAAQRQGTQVRDPRALLYTTARHLLADDHRRASVRRPLSHAGHPDDEPIDPDQHAGPPTLEPEVAVASRQRFEAMADTIDRLPPRCREAFVLVKFDGLSHAETASRMGIAVKTVEMQVQIALRACRERLDALEGSPPNAPRATPPAEPPSPC